MPRTRSPAHPFVGLPTALEKTKDLFEAIQRNPASREIVANGLGFNRLHGQSRRFIATLTQYGLLEKVGDEMRISELAVACLLAETEEEKADALRRSASSPNLFEKLQAKYASGVPGEEMASNWLMREGFSPDGARCAARAYRETMLHLPETGTSEREDPLGEEDVGIDTAASATREEAHAPSAGPESGQFRVQLDEKSRVDVQAVQLGPEEVRRLCDMLNHFLGDDSQSGTILLSHDD